MPVGDIAYQKSYHLRLPVVLHVKIQQPKIWVHHVKASAQPGNAAK